jgi:hypothetical protein
MAKTKEANVHTSDGISQKAAAYNVDGGIVAFYDSLASPVPDGVTVIDITDDEWQTCLAEPGWTVQGGALVPPEPLTGDELLAIDQAQLCEQIDAAADTAYATIGGSPGRIAEHAQTAAEATEYQEAGYAGKAPPSVACWAKASGLTMAKAADDIVAAAERWQAAIADIRAARLLGKAAVRGATTSARAKAAATKAIEQIQAAGAGR